MSISEEKKHKKAIQKLKEEESVLFTLLVFSRRWSVTWPEWLPGLIWFALWYWWWWWVCSAPRMGELLLWSRYSGVVVAKLPFEPIALFRGIFRAGLKKSTDPRDCCMVWLFYSIHRRPRCTSSVTWVSARLWASLGRVMCRSRCCSARSLLAQWEDFPSSWKRRKRRPRSTTRMTKSFMGFGCLLDIDFFRYLQESVFDNRKSRMIKNCLSWKWQNNSLSWKWQNNLPSNRVLTHEDSEVEYEQFHNKHTYTLAIISE